MLHSAVIQANDFVAALLAEAIEHERIPADAVARETATINRYLSSAIQATQNYLDKDLWPTVHTYSGIDVWPLYWTRGNVRSISAIVPAPTAQAPAAPAAGSLYTPPAGWVLDDTVPLLDGGMDLRSGRLLINVPAGSFGGSIVVEGGFEFAEDLPDDVVEFILAVFGTHYAVRESSNYSSMVFNVDNYPKYLLDPYRTLSYA